MHLLNLELMKIKLEIDKQEINNFILNFLI